MPLSPEQIERLADANAAAVGLPLDPAHRPGVLMYLRLASGIADAVLALPLTPHDDPAEAFVPIGPDDLPDAQEFSGGTP